MKTNQVTNINETEQPVFEIAGGRYTLAQMLFDNAHDDYVCAWLKSAKVGEAYPDPHAEPVKRVS